MNRLWIFDFDGTLVDSEKAIKSCYLQVANELAPERLDYVKKMLIGPTLQESAKMILTEKNLSRLRKFIERFKDLYDDLIIYETKQYPNVTSTLKKLRNRGDELCILTNKRSEPTKKLINYYEWDSLFSFVACMDEYPSLQNKSEIIKIKKNEILHCDKKYFIGDTINDGFAAQKNNIKFIKANYGYGNKENWSNIKIFKSIDNFKEIIDI